MTAWWVAARASARTELGVSLRTPMVIAFAFGQAVLFLLLVSLFGLTGSKAPTALIDDDHGIYGAQLVRELVAAHHSFDLRPMSAAQAVRELKSGRLVASITIPAGFSDAVRDGRTVALPVRVDNVDVDMTDDIQRAIPDAIVGFGEHLRLPQIRVHVDEIDLLPRDTSYIGYLAVSALALDAFLLPMFLAGVAVAREWESGTLKLWRLAPAPPSALLAGKLAVSVVLSLLALAVTTLVVVVGYGVPAGEPATIAGGLVLSVLIAVALGAWIAGLVRRTAVLIPLVFGLAMPLYMDSGTLEPERFDGDTIWAIAHVTPVYYAVGIFERAFHGLEVTPESIGVNVLALAGFGAVAAFLAARSIRRAVLR